jgi:hypothetical protein
VKQTVLRLALPRGAHVHVWVNVDDASMKLNAQEPRAALFLRVFRPVSDVPWIDNHNAWTELRHSPKVWRVECEQMRYSVDMTHGHESTVVDLLTDDPQPLHKGFPCWVNVRRFCEHRKGRLESRCLRLRVHSC